MKQKDQQKNVSKQKLSIYHKTISFAPYTKTKT